MRKLVRAALVAGSLAGVAVPSRAQQPAPAVPPAAAPAAQAPDVWAPVRLLEGEWTGVAGGAPGAGTVHRSYQFVLGGRFLHERNVSAYAPKEAGKPGELHEHWSFLSYDKRRKTLVLRQFHQEGFVNQYALAPPAAVPSTDVAGPRRLVFVSEAFENLDASWRARETYEFNTVDEFVEIFELAEPGKEFEVYSRNVFRRVRPR